MLCNIIIIHKSGCEQKVSMASQSQKQQNGSSSSLIAPSRVMNENNIECGY